MGVSEKEIDFPRDGASVVRASHSTKSEKSGNLRSDVDANQLFGVAKKRKSKSKDHASSEAPSKKKKYEERAAVWSKPITKELLTDGVMGLGVVIEIHEDYVLLETADSCRVKLPATQISKKFTELLKLDKISLDSVFIIGQMVPFRVIQRSAQNSTKGSTSFKNKENLSKLPVVSCDPSKLYSHLSPARLVPGLVLHGIVESVEEKGAILDIGLQSVQGFLPTKKQQHPAEVGHPIVIRVETAKTSRVITVTSYVEQDNLSLEACESLQLNHLTPGTIIDCEPDMEPSITAGIYVTLGNGVRGFVAKSHLPPRLRSDITKVGRVLRCVVMFCQQNTHLLVLSAHPDIVAISKPEKRSSFMGYSIGDRLKCNVIDIVPSSSLVCFSLPPTEDGKIPLISAISYKKYLSKPEEIESLYPIGSEHMCRVMNFRYADRCMLVSTRKDLLKQKFVSYKDAVPGQVIEAKVTDVHPRGVQVALNEFVKGFIPKEHTSDKAIALNKAFTVGKSIKCRVWFVNDTKKQVWLSARPSLVDYRGAVITDYTSKNEGIVSVGVVKKVLETGGAIVQFFGTVRGLLHANEAKRLGSEIREGQVLEVRVTSVNVTANKMTLSLADESTGSGGHIINPKGIDFSLGENSVCAIVDDVMESTVTGRKSERATLHLEHDSSVKGCLVSNLVSDSLDSPFESMKTTFRSGLELSPVAPLGSVGGVNRFTTKRFVCEWLRCFKDSVPKQFTDVKPGQLVCGVISQRVLGECLYVELAGGSGLIGKVAFVNIDGGEEGANSLQIGQTVLARIRNVHAEKKTFRVSLMLSDCVPEQNLMAEAPSPSCSLALQLLRSSVEEMIALAEFSSANLPSPGMSVISTISQIVDEVLFVTFSGNLTGCVRKGNYKDGVKVGDKIKCLVIDYVYPRNDAELVMIEPVDASSSKKKNKKNQTEKDAGKARVLLIKRDYIVVLPNKNHLMFVPTRFHPNQVVEIKNARVSCGDDVQIEYSTRLTDGVQIGLLQGDGELIANLLPSTEYVAKTFPGKKPAVNSKEVVESRPKSKSELGIQTKSIKNLKTYTGTVIGPWTSDDRHDHGKLAALIQLPGGNIGRLHVSELPSRLLIGSAFPLEEFIKRNRKKTVVVKIINFVSIKRGDSKVRVAELTMADSKMAETRKKASLVAFQRVFKPGEIVRCFVIPNQEMTSKDIRVEVNPFWSGRIAHEAVSDDMKVVAPEHDGEVFECLPKGGEVHMAKVLSAIKIKKGHGHGLLNLAFDMQANVKKFEPGRRLVARVTHVKLHPLSVQFHLVNGQRAILCATAIASNYEKVHQHIGHFKLEGIFHLYALRQEQNPQRNYVCAEGRYEAYLKQKQAEVKIEDRRRLLVDRSEATVGLTCDGFVAKHTSDAILVEIGPGIVGRLRKAHHPDITSITLNSVITVRVRHVDAEGRISLSLVGIIYRASAIQDRKRMAEEAESVVPKKEKRKEIPSEPLEKVELSDPGFDWSNAGFRPEDLAAVGKLGADEEEDNASATNGITASNDEIQKPTGTKKDRVEEVKTVKALTKEEQDMEKERRLANREFELSGDFQPETQEDFARLLRKDPNSAEIWIRYISFFLEKNDLAKARATAERALTVINYREEAEIFNIWTAFLNMEVAYGDETSTKEVFSRACGNADAFKMHKQMAAIYSDTNKNQEADEIYEVMVKKFRANSDDVWTLYGEHLMKTDRSDAARDLMKRALTSVPKQRHIPLISRFAQMEFRNGDVERGRTLFESLVTAYPKKTDVWLVYADLCLKHSGIEMGRQVLERACALPLSMHKLRPLFRKWMEAEQRFGDDKSRLLLREKAEKYLQMNLEEEVEEFENI